MRREHHVRGVLRRESMTLSAVPGRPRAVRLALSERARGGGESEVMNMRIDEKQEEGREAGEEDAGEAGEVEGDHVLI